MDVARPHILQRIEAYSEKEIRFNLMVTDCSCGFPCRTTMHQAVAVDIMECSNRLHSAIVQAIVKNRSTVAKEALQQAEELHVRWLSHRQSPSVFPTRHLLD